MSEKKTTGSCLCGSVRYEITGDTRDVVACHCTPCRKQSGHFWTSFTVWTDQFRLTEDKGLKWYHASDHSRRGFCSECGSSILFETLDSGKISPSAGSVDGPTHLETIGHIYTATKGDYYDLDDGLPNYEDTDNGAFPMPPKQHA
ncbi:MAG: GFA family protein [Alphaproteobacteria bacterium]